MHLQRVSSRIQYLVDPVVLTQRNAKKVTEVKVQNGTISQQSARFVTI
jgi:hypothetical protein